MSEAERAVELREALVAKLREDRVITSDPVAAAFSRVPRHAFVPAGTSLEDAYDADCAPPTKWDEHGVIISSVSAPFLQAQMIEQAQLRPGASVLEIGSGGYNAMLLAEVVGPQGRVVSVDIDSDVTGRATEVVKTTGYGDRVQVVLADAEHGVPGAEPFDAIIVTVGAWDVPPGWLAQLAPEGVLVVPLRMNGVTRSIAFVRDGDHLVSLSAHVCGFVPMQGMGEHRETVFALPDGRGHQVRLRFDTGAPEDPSLDRVLASDRSEVWSGVTIANQTSFADLYLWFACYLPGFCSLVPDDGTELATERRERKNWFPVAVLAGDSFAYLGVRPAMDGGDFEFGVYAYGPNGQRSATSMLEQIQAWDRLARHGQPPTFGYWPRGSERSRLPGGAAVLEKNHGLVSISWPTG